MIRFPCQHCGAKLSVPRTHAGQEGRCPRCQRRLTVPAAPPPEASAAAETAAPIPGAAATPFDEALLDRRPKPPVEPAERDARRRELEAMARLDLTPSPVHSGQRQRSWPVDILLYPANRAGLTILGIVVGIPLLLALAARVPLLGPSMRLLSFVVHIVLGLFAAWYFAECVHDSAKGGTRAPDALSTAHLSDMRSRVLNLLAVMVVFAWPAGLYWICTDRIDIVFWALVAWAILFSPIGVLAMVLHDATFVLNPLFLLGAIFRALVPYVGLLLLSAALAGLFWLAFVRPGQIPLVGGLFRVVGPFASVYLALVLAHLLGRFYWRYRARLDWAL